MKKAALILLLSLYTLSVAGIGIKQFYCCGKLKSTSISFTREAKEKCKNGDEKSDCCKTKYQTFKVKDSHIAAADISSPAKHFTDVHLITPSFDIITALVTGPVNHTNESHAPPLHHGVPIYILNCVYRI